MLDNLLFLGELTDKVGIFTANKNSKRIKIVGGIECVFFSRPHNTNFCVFLAYFGHCTCLWLKYNN